MDLDRSFGAYQEVVKESEFLSTQPSQLTEADTRSKLIDRVLKDVLDWPEASIERETHVSGEASGFTDYRLRVSGKPIVTVEAKRQGISFEFPRTFTRQTAKIESICALTPALNAAIIQVRSYCDEIGCQFAVVTNGDAWIAFKAIRTDMPWRKGDAIVFRDSDFISRNFAKFLGVFHWDAIRQGNLIDHFSPAQFVGASSQRVVDLLFDAQAPLHRNRLSAQLSGFIDKFFQDIAQQDEIRILESCYVHSGPMSQADNALNQAIQDTVPRFLLNQGTEQLITGPAMGGSLHRKVEEEVIKAEKHGQLYLLLGGIGSGKTTFLMRYLRSTSNPFLQEHAVWLYIPFLAPPSDPRELDNYICDQVIDLIRKHYSTLIVENRRTLKKAFEREITLFYETTLKPENLSPDEAERRISPFLDKLVADSRKYAPALLSLCTKRNRAVLICLDNVDQLDDEYQDKLFFEAQRISREWGAITILSLREETYFAASVQKRLNAYSNRKYHVSSPTFRLLINKRLAFVNRVLMDPSEPLSLVMNSGVMLNQDDILKFFRIIQQSIFGGGSKGVGSRRIGKFIDHVCQGNMRRGLEMFSVFLTSGATDVDKMLKIFVRDQRYTVAYHEFLRSVMLGDHKYYHDTKSPIKNLFYRTEEKHASHFTCLRILSFLTQRSAFQTEEGLGYVGIQAVIDFLAGGFDNSKDVIIQLQRLVRTGAIQVNTQSSDSLDMATHCRITLCGAYYKAHLSGVFAYLDLVSLDTPISDPKVVSELLEYTKKIDQIGAGEDLKIARTEERIARAECFLRYLEAQEIAELDGNKNVLLREEHMQSMIPEIRRQFTGDIEYIRRRFGENASAYDEDE